MSVTQESQPAAVDISTCSRLKNTDKPFILVLKMGQPLVASILECAQIVNLKSASLSGLGALDDVTVAYYNLQTKQYQTKVFTGMYELIALQGNISMVEGRHFLHIHAALGTEEYNVIGGHIMDAVVGPTAEITIVPLSAAITREFNGDIGLKLMCPLAEPSSRA